MSMPCKSKDCFICQLENKEIKEMFRVESNQKRMREKLEIEYRLRLINYAILIISFILIVSLSFLSNKK